MRVLIAVALLMLCGALAQRIEPQAAKQEKTQPAIPPCADGTAGCYLTAAPYDHTNFPLCKDAAKGQPCWSVPPLAFDLPLICGLLAFIACMVTGLLFKACEILAELRKR